MANNGGLGGFFVRWSLDGEFNGFVFWITSETEGGQPFTVSGGQITFLPGTYNNSLTVR